MLKWPTARPTLATLVDEFSLPLPDAAVDRILLVHALEMSDDPAGLLREVWRVLAPSGPGDGDHSEPPRGLDPHRQHAVRPWPALFASARSRSCCGRPGSRRSAWSEALFVPPIDGGWFLRSAVAWERIGAAISLPFAGVHIVEATKQVYRAIPARRERTRLIPALEPVLVPTAAPRRDEACWPAEKV